MQFKEDKDPHNLIEWNKSNQKVLGLVVAWHLGVLIPEKRLYVSHVKHINKPQLISVRFQIEKRRGFDEQFI